MGWTKAAYKRYEFHSSFAWGQCVGGGIVGSNFVTADELPNRIAFLFPICLFLAGILMGRRTKREFLLTATPTDKQSAHWKILVKWNRVVPVFLVTALVVFTSIPEVGWAWLLSIFVAIIGMALIFGRLYRARVRAFKETLDLDETAPGLCFPTFLETGQSGDRDAVT